MNRSNIFVIVCIMLILGSMRAKAEEKKFDSCARIDILSKNIVLTPYESSNGTVKNISWGNQEKQKYAIISQTHPLSREEWITYSFSFTPESEGNVLITLTSNWTKDEGKKNMNSHWIRYKSVIAKGAAIKNTDFNEKNGSSLPKSWSMNTLNLAGERDGRLGVRAWHNCPISQTISVKKGQKVTLTVVAKAGEFERAIK